MLHDGAALSPSVRNITVQVFGNESYERGIEFQMTEQIREHILEESDVRLVGSSEAADAFIRGKILRVDYPVLVGREQSGILEGSSTIAVEAELVDTRTGRVLARVGGSDLAEFTASLNENRATAVANTIEELAWKVLLGLSERSEGGDRSERASCHGSVAPLADLRIRRLGASRESPVLVDADASAGTTGRMGRRLTARTSTFRLLFLAFYAE